MSGTNVALLEVEARFHHERLTLYRAKRYSGRPTREARFRELERASNAANGRLLAARRTAAQLTASIVPADPSSPRREGPPWGTTTLTLERSGASAGLARSQVRLVLSGSLESDRLSDCVLMTSEVVTNAIEYSRTGRIELRVAISDTRARIEVYNRAEQWTRGPELQPRGLDQVGGWGLFIVEKLSDRWGTDATETLVWFELDRRPQ